MVDELLEVGSGGEVAGPVGVFIATVREVVIVVLDRPCDVQVVQSLQITSWRGVDDIYIGELAVYVPVNTHD